MRCGYGETAPRILIHTQSSDLFHVWLRWIRIGGKWFTISSHAMVRCEPLDGENGFINDFQSKFCDWFMMDFRTNRIAYHVCKTCLGTCHPYHWGYLKVCSSSHSFKWIWNIILAAPAKSANFPNFFISLVKKRTDHYAKWPYFMPNLSADMLCIWK